MADEAQIRTSLQVKSGNLTYQSQPTAFNADMDSAKGPTPGAFSASVAGTDVNLSQLVRPGLCRIMNLDEDNFVHVGIWSPDAHLFFPLMELLPGETYVLRLSRDLGDEYLGAGTGTGAPPNTLRVKADTAACNVLVEAFEA